MARVEDFLRKRKEDGLLRELRPASSREKGYIRVDGREYLDLSSNDYLGLSANPYIKEASKRGIDGFGASASASRLLSGDLDIFHDLQRRIASFKGKESALVFNSGYQLNTGLISALCQKGDLILSDRLNHASIVDGILLSGSKFFRFRHNDMVHLESILEKERSKYESCLIISETIFSMDGDKPPLEELVALKKKHNCTIMVDEAHATGIFGEKGAGVVQEYGLQDDIDIIMGTFSKALGSFGAYAACSREMYDFLINACRSFIYSTALPPAVITANIASLEMIDKEPYRRKELIKNSDYFRNRLKASGFEVRGSSQIVPLIVGSSDKALEMSQRLRDRGYWVLAIRPPTIPEGSARLRFSLTYDHKRDVLEGLLDDISL